MGSFPSVSPDNLEAFKTLKAKYEALKQEGCDDDEIFLALKQEFVCLSKGDIGGEALSIAVEKSNPVDVDSNENVRVFLNACGAFFGGKSSVDLKKAQQMYDDGLVTANCVDSDGWCALHHGCGEGNLQVVKWITSSCPDVNINLATLEGCTPLWVASFNGRRDVVQHLLLLGADDGIKGKPEGEPMTSPSMAARRNRKPGLADLLDTERELREKDPNRVLRQIAKEMTVEEYRDSIREASKIKQSVS